MHYAKEKGPDSNYPPTLSGLFIHTVTHEKSEYAIYIEGLDDKPVTDINIQNCTFKNVQKENFVKDVKDLRIENTMMNGEKVNNGE